MSGETKDPKTTDSGLGTWIMRIAGIAAIAVAALWLWDKDRFNRWLGFDDTDKDRVTNRRNPDPSPTPIPRGKSDEGLLTRLTENGSSSKEAAARQLEQVAGKDWRAKAENLLQQMENPTGVLPLTLLPNKGENAGVLRADFTLSKPRNAQESLEMRRYLHEWRQLLGQLRVSSLKALRDVDSDKLRDLPTLSLAKELAEPRYKALEQKATEPPELPWFTAEDEQTAEFLSHLFTRSDAGKAFITHRDRVALTRVPTLVQALDALHTEKTVENHVNSWQNEIAMAVKNGVPRPPLDESVSPAMRSVMKLLQSDRWRKAVKMYSSASLKSALDSRDGAVGNAAQVVESVVNPNAGLPHKDLPPRNSYSPG